MTTKIVVPSSSPLTHIGKASDERIVKDQTRKSAIQIISMLDRRTCH